MKEAAGEANMTVITIVLIGLVAAAGAILIPNLLTNTEKQSKCSAAGGTWYSNACYPSTSCSKGANNKLSCTGTTINVD